MSRFDVVFADSPAGDEFTSLDVLVSREEHDQPIVVWVHGGGWVGGDKRSHESNPALATWFGTRGEIFVPMNYRLVGDAHGTTYAEQAEDVAAGIAWVVKHAPEFCGDSSRVHVIGYSAGAHLVALVATDRRYLAAHGLDPADLTTVVSLDVNAYDIPWAIENAAEHGYPGSAVNLPMIFGRDLDGQTEASPITHIETAAVPPSLVVSVYDQNGVTQSLSPAASQRYVDALVAAGNDGATFEATDDSHASLASDYGTPGDAVTDVVAAFLDAH